MSYTDKTHQASSPFFLLYFEGKEAEFHALVQEPIHRGGGKRRMTDNRSPDAEFRLILTQPPGSLSSTTRASRRLWKLVPTLTASLFGV